MPYYAQQDLTGKHPSSTYGLLATTDATGSIFTGAGNQITTLNVTASYSITTNVTASIVSSSFASSSLFTLSASFATRSLTATSASWASASISSSYATTTLNERTVPDPFTFKNVFGTVAVQISSSTNVTGEDVGGELILGGTAVSAPHCGKILFKQNDDSINNKTSIICDTAGNLTITPTASLYLSALTNSFGNNVDGTYADFSVGLIKFYSSVSASQIQANILSGSFKHTLQPFDYNTTINVDFDLSDYQIFAVSGSMDFTTSNLGPGKSVKLIVDGQFGDELFLSFPVDWIWYDSITPSQTSGKVYIFELFSAGTTDANVHAKFYQQNGNDVSHATTSDSSNFANTSTSASYARTASYAIQTSVTSSIVSSSVSVSSSWASQSLWATTSSYASNSVWAVTSSFASRSLFTTTSSFASSSHTASFLTLGRYNVTDLTASLIRATSSAAISSSWATISGVSNSSSYSISSSITVSSSYAVTSSFLNVGRYSITDLTASLLKGTSSAALSSSTAISSSISISSSYTINSSTASYFAPGLPFAQGSLDTIANGPYSHAEGADTQALGTGSHSEGSSNTAFGDFSHTEGASGGAFGVSSHVEGANCFTVGLASHAEGTNCITSGSWSHAEGNLTITTGLGTASHAEGIGTITSGSYQHAQGRYNRQGNTSSLMIIGNGTDDTNRSDLAVFNSQSIQFNQQLQQKPSIISGSHIPTVGLNGSMVFELTSNTTLVVKVRGNDGVMRVGTITLS